jgi:hypothetical protein
MVRKLIGLLDQYDVRKKFIAYVEDEGANLNAMTTIVEECDLKSLQPILLKYYHHLHLVDNYDVEST